MTVQKVLVAAVAVLVALAIDRTVGVSRWLAAA